MRLYLFFLTTTIALFACIDASSTRSTFERSTTLDQHEPQRFLRDGADTKEEERGGGVDFARDVSEKILNSLSKKNPVEAAFEKTFGLKPDIDRLLRMPEFKEWFSHVVDETTKGEPYTKMAEFLAARYGDDVLAQMLADSSRNHIETKDTATKLQEGLVNSWSNHAWKKSAATEQFKLLFPRDKLSTIRNDLLRTPLFDLWTKYVKKTVKSKGDQYKVMAKTLVGRYGDDDLVQLLDASFRQADTKYTANRLQLWLMDSWAKEKSKTKDFAAEKFDRLFPSGQLRNIGDDLISSPRFKMWDTYVALAKNNEADRYAIMVKVLVARFGDDGLVNMLDAHSIVADTKNIVTGLLKALQNSWTQQKLTTDDLLNRLFPRDVPYKIGDDLLSSPCFDMWASHVKRANNHEDIQYATMGTAMVARFGDDLVKILDAHRKVADTKKIATGLQDALKKALVVSWFQRGENAGSLFDLLFPSGQHHKIEDDLLSTLRLDMWTTYVKKTADDPWSAMLSVLRDRVSKKAYSEITAIGPASEEKWAEVIFAE